MSSPSPRPHRGQALLQQALQHHQNGRISAAAASYAELRRLEPNLFEGYHLGGTAALQLGKLDQAVTLLQRAIQLRPSSGVTYMCLGLALGQLGRAPEAEKQLRAATRIDPKNFEAWCNLASVLVMEAKLDEAANAYRHSLELQPTQAQGWSGLGCVLQMQGRPREACEHQTRALALDPKHAKALSSRAQSRQSLNQIEEALSDFETHLANHPDDLEAASFRLFLLNYDSARSRDGVFAEHQAFGRKVGQVAGGASRRAFPNPRDANKRLRVAFFSPDLREHSVAFFIEPILRCLDRKDFEVFIYHDHCRVDQISQRIQGYAVQWRNFVCQIDSVVEAQILKDAPDIVVELAGHSGFNRMPLMGRRVAPVQISYLGYPNTTGVQTMDYRFTDAIADPENDSEAWHTERLVRFSSTAWVYQPPDYAPMPTSPPVLRGEPLTFGSFNNISKLSEGTLQLWAKVLEAVPGSRLLLKGLFIDEPTLRTKAQTAGIAMDRLLILSARSTPAEHLACYEKIDIALDPFPYSGTTTTCEALWMGVPVISLYGDRHASRVGASLLSAIGHREWIAKSPETYLEIARTLAADLSALATFRAQLREDMQRSPLLHSTAQATLFGAALRQCWVNACGSQNPSHSTPPVTIAGLPHA